MVMQSTHMADKVNMPSNTVKYDENLTKCIEKHPEFHMANLSMSEMTLGCDMTLDIMYGQLSLNRFI